MQAKPVSPIHGIWGLIGLSAIFSARLLGAQLSSAVLECPSRIIIGLRCPTCGTTTALIELSQFRFIEALLANPLLVVGGILISVWGIAAFITHLIGRPMKRWANTPSRRAFQRYALIIAIALGWGYQLFIRA